MEADSEQYSTREARRTAGRRLRSNVARTSQGQFDPTARKFDPVKLMNAAHKDREPDLMPLKNARMSLTPSRFIAEQHL